MNSVRHLPILQRHDEMSLQDTLSDALIQRVMAADNVDPGKLAAMLNGIAAVLAARSSGIVRNTGGCRMPC